MPQIPVKGNDSWTVETNAEFEAFFLSDREIYSGWFVTFAQHPRYGAGWLAYRDPVKTLVAWDQEEVLGILDEVGEETRGDRYAAGFVAFDAAPAFDAALSAHRCQQTPLACFHVFERPPRFYKELLCSRPSDRLRIDWKPEIDRETYLAKCNQVRQHLAQGDTYQVNLSLRFQGDLDADLPTVFANLVAENPPPYAGLFMSEHAQVASLSPELFFERSGSRIRCRPMKGTAAIGATPRETSANAEALRASEKNRAENLMIVDMIRNDLGRIAKLGSVRTTSIFEVEAFPTVLQMTSTVEAETGHSLRETFGALFPCASIVGAPKVETLRIIKELEESPRGIYTGAIGIVGPSREARFAVAIRTISGRRGSRSRTYGAGSGIVWDSEPESEWQETLLKTEALHRSSSEWSLFETFRWPDWPDAPRLDRHLDRLSASAQRLGIPFQRSRAIAALEEATSTNSMVLRVRLLLTQRGGISVEFRPLNPSPEVIEARVASTPICEEDPSLRIKSNRRDVYDRRVRDAGTEEVILWNQRGQVTELSKGNLVAKIGGELVTPPLSCGLLPGVFRGMLLESGEITERTLLLRDLYAAEELHRINSLTEWIRIGLVDGSTHLQKDVD